MVRETSPCNVHACRTAAPIRLRRARTKLPGTKLHNDAIPGRGGFNNLAEKKSKQKLKDSEGKWETVVERGGTSFQRHLNANRAVHTNTRWLLETYAVHTFSDSSTHTIIQISSRITQSARETKYRGAWSFCYKLCSNSPQPGYTLELSEEL